MARKLQDKTIVITGASSGIGAATAIACAEAGMDVVLAARRADRLNAVASEIEKRGRRAVTVQCDVSRDADVARLFEQAWSELGRVDVAFANAGYGLASSVLDTTDQQHRHIFEVNYFGTLRVVRESVPYLRRTADGLRHLLICSSAGSEIGLPWFGAYSATKAAQDSIAGALRSELQDEIEVTSVHPVGTKTAFFEIAEQMAGGSGPGKENTPEPFRQSPEKVARKIVRALRRPRAEVWPMPMARWALGLATIVPGLANRIMKRASRGEDPARNRVSSAQASDTKPQETTHESP